MPTNSFNRRYIAIQNMISLLLANQGNGEEYPLVGILQSLIPDLENANNQEKALDQAIGAILNDNFAKEIYKQLVGLAADGSRFFIPTPGDQIIPTEGFIPLPEDPTGPYDNDWISFRCPKVTQHGIIQVNDARKVPSCPVCRAKMVKVELPLSPS